MKTTGSNNSGGRNSSNASPSSASKDMAPPEFLPQPEFLQVLLLEEKRTKRSGMAFGLVKIDAPGLFGNPIEKQACDILVEDLRFSLRDTDQCGWYVAGKTMGVIFIELHPESAATTSESLMRDLQARLKPTLPGASTLRFSVSIFPQRESGRPKRTKEMQVAHRR